MDVLADTTGAHMMTGVFGSSRRRWQALTIPEAFRVISGFRRM